MQNQSPFTIYNASAGSGKTFTLVKDYLKILFESKSKLAFRNILALTFTNKAVAEMKERIINMLKLFSDKKNIESPHPMFESLMKELNMEPEELQQKSKTLLQTIVHNYAAFDISTIDKFNHKLIRTFAYDLKLPINFEVELDTTTMLAKAVDKLIDKAGSDATLTKVLVDFAIEKTDDDKSWNIAYDFNEIGKLLINENDIPYLAKLEDKTLADFKALKTNLQSQQKDIDKQIVDLAESTLSIIEKNNLEVTDFSRQTLPNHFKKACNLDFYRLYDNKLQDNLANNTSIYNKSLDPETATTIDGLLPQIETNYLNLKRLVHTSKFLRNALKNITPLSVLTAIGKSLQDIKEEEDLLLISEFNAIINKEIKAQPAPFIYERIGEKFKHYFIDEFQDTSELQWENLIPLIENAISGENLKNETGTNMLVGDAKQAIYRWRGGRAEQFIDLYTKKTNPFTIEQDVAELPTNYRSHKTVVEFNNTFFEHVSGFAFSNPQHQEVYKKVRQEAAIDQPGYIQLDFLNIEDAEKDELHCEAVANTIEKTHSQGFSYKDICVIVRRKKEGFAIAEYLTNIGLPIISSESLLIKNAPEVQFINQLITLSIQPKNDEFKVALLNFLSEEKLDIIDRHQFFKNLVHLDINAFFKQINAFGFDFDFKTFLQLPLYEAIESVIRGFQLNVSSNAYLQFYLDEIFDYSQRYNASFIGFIDYWERKKDKLSIVSPLEKDAIQIMTIHKSKGLEFPVVIFPYANQDVYFDMSPKLWFPVDKSLFNGFPYLFINMNKDLEAFNDLGAEIYRDYRSQLELDSLNLLYVVLTRAEEQLFIISENDFDKKTKSEKLTHYSGLFISYLKSTGQWNDNENQYSFGELTRRSKAKNISNTTLEQSQFISTKKESHNLNILTNSGYLWDTAQEEAIERGNLVHNILSHINTKDDIDFALSHFSDTGQINSKQLDSLRPIIENIVNHNQLAYLFDGSLTIINEQDIISEKGTLLRPDRVVVNSNNQATIIDYKTGLENTNHKEQLYDYQYVLEQMNFEVIKKILIYINDDIVIKEF